MDNSPEQKQEFIKVHNYHGNNYTYINSSEKQILKSDSRAMLREIYLKFPL